MKYLVKNFSRKTLCVASYVDDNDYSATYVESTPESVFMELEELNDKGDEPIISINIIRNILCRYLEILNPRLSLAKTKKYKGYRAIMYSIIYNNLDFEKIIKEYSITKKEYNWYYKNFENYCMSNFKPECDLMEFIKKFGKEIAEGIEFEIEEMHYKVQDNYVLNTDRFSYVRICKKSNTIQSVYLKNYEDDPEVYDWITKTYQKYVYVSRSKLFEDKKLLQYVLACTLKYCSCRTLNYLALAFKFTIEDIMTNKSKFNMFFDRIDNYYDFDDDDDDLFSLDEFE